MIDVTQYDGQAFVLEALLDYALKANNISCSEHELQERVDSLVRINKENLVITCIEFGTTSVGLGIDLRNPQNFNENGFMAYYPTANVNDILEKYRAAINSKHNPTMLDFQINHNYYLLKRSQTSSAIPPASSTPLKPPTGIFYAKLPVKPPVGQFYAKVPVESADNASEIELLTTANGPLANTQGQVESEANTSNEEQLPAASSLLTSNSVFIEQMPSSLQSGSQNSTFGFYDPLTLSPVRPSKKNPDSVVRRSPHKVTPNLDRATATTARLSKVATQNLESHFMSGTNQGSTTASRRLSFSMNMVFGSYESQQSTCALSRERTRTLSSSDDVSRSPQKLSPKG